MTNAMLLVELNTLNDLEAMIEELKAEAETIKDSIKDTMNQRGVDELEVGDYVVKYTSVLSSRFDTKRFKEVFGADMYKAYTKEVSSKRFTVSH